MRTLQTVCLVVLVGCATGASSPLKVKSCADAHALAAEREPVRVLVYFENKAATHRAELDAVLGTSGYEPIDEAGGASLIEVDDDAISQLCASERIEQLTPSEAYPVLPARFK